MFLPLCRIAMRFMVITVALALFVTPIVYAEVCLVTGASSGIGKATAMALAKNGCEIFFAARASHETAIEHLTNEMRSEYPELKAHFIELDLENLATVVTLVNKLKEQDIKIDKLINNAGVFQKQLIVTHDGLESTFQINFLGHFLLTLLLANEDLFATYPVIATIISERLVVFDIEKEFEKKAKNHPWGFSLLEGERAYSTSKTMLLMFNNMLFDWLFNQGIYAYCVAIHPGGVNTGIYNNVPLGKLIKKTMKPAQLAAMELIALTQPSLMERHAVPTKMIGTTLDTKLLQFTQNKTHQRLVWNLAVKILQEKQVLPEGQGWYLIDTHPAIEQGNGYSCGLFAHNQCHRYYQSRARNVEDVTALVEHVTKNGKHELGQKLVVSAGNYITKEGGVPQGFSIDRQAQGYAQDIYLLTNELITHELPAADVWYDDAKQTLLVTVLSGTSWNQLITLANQTLSSDERDRYQYLPFSSPTTDQISIGGCLAAGTYSRTTSVQGGYFLDAVESFEVVTLKDGKATALLVSRKDDPDLFYAIAGSFGRGGVVTKVTLRLQKVLKSSLATTKIKQFNDMDEFILDLHAQRLHAQDDVLNKKSVSCIRSVYGILTGNCSYIFSSELKDAHEARGLSSFPVYDNSPLGLILHEIGHKSPRLAQEYTDQLLVNRSNGFTEYKNEARNWVYFQNSYVKFHAFDPKAESRHQAYAVPDELLPQFLAMTSQFIKDGEENFNVRPKLIDIIYLPATSAVMSPFYDQGPLKNGGFLYTITWPITDKRQHEGVERFREATLQAFSSVRIHPIKEFSGQSRRIREDYAEQSRKLEQILNINRIDDSFMWNQIQGVLYKKERYPDTSSNRDPLVQANI